MNPWQWYIKRTEIIERMNILKYGCDVVDESLWEAYIKKFALIKIIWNAILIVLLFAIIFVR